MSALAEQVHEHAGLVAAGQLERAKGRLADLGPEQKRAVEDLAVTLARQIADLLLEEGRRNHLVAAALDSIYSTNGLPPAGAAVAGRDGRAGPAAPRQVHAQQPRRASEGRWSWSWRDSDFLASLCSSLLPGRPFKETAPG